MANQKASNLDGLRETVRQEISLIEQAAQQTNLPSSLTKAERIKVVWAISGSGTYLAPLTDLAVDQLYLNKPWAHWSDKKRLDHAALVICKIIELISGKEIKWRPGQDNDTKTTKEAQLLVKRYGPTLIYNGIPIQRDALLKAISNLVYPIPKEKVFFSGGDIVKTMDQVKNLALPPGLKMGPNDLLGVITYIPHYARMLRMLNHYKPLGNVKIKLFPLAIEDKDGNAEFTEMELNGVVGYVERGESSTESYPYEI